MAELGEGGREAGSSPHHHPGQNKDMTLDVRCVLSRPRIVLK